MVHIPFRDKEVFTTGEAAEACYVGKLTIIRCFDKELLEGFHVPGSHFRRIPRKALLRFMRTHGIPTDALEDPYELRVNLLSGRGEVPPSWNGFLQSPPEHTALRTSQSGFELGMRLADAKRRGEIVHGVILDCRGRLRDGIEGEADLETTVEGLKRLKTGNDHFRNLTIALLHEESIDPSPSEIPIMGEDHRYRRDHDPRKIIAHFRAEHDLELIS